MMLWSLPLLPLLGGLALFVSGTSKRHFLATAATAILLLTLAVAIAAAMNHWTGTWQWSDTFALSARLTPLSSIIAILVPVVALPVTVNAALQESEKGLSRLVALMLIFAGGMLLVVIANDLLTLLLGWELIGACSWALIAHDWRDHEAPESGLYAFITTRFGDLGLFVAAMALYGETGSLSFDAIALLGVDTLSLVAFAILLSAASKAGQLPFSSWLFRAMAGPASVSALLHAATLVAAGVYLLARLEPVLRQATGFSGVTLLIGLLTALGGGLVAIRQLHAKKLLAASTSSQLGFMFVAIGAGYPAVAIVHLAIHALYKAPLFMAVGLAGHRVGSYRLSDMQLGRAMPTVAVFSAMTAVALAGLPPSGGSWSKEQVVAAAAHVNDWMAFGMIVAGGLSAAYATRFIILAFAPGQHRQRVSANTVPIGLLSILTLLASVLWWEPVPRWISTLLGNELPESSIIEFVASLLALTVGVLVGQYRARADLMNPISDSGGVANWFALPLFISRTITDPVDHIARYAARADDQFLDALPRRVAQSAVIVASQVARFDDRQVDRGIEWSASASLAMARLSKTPGEAWIDDLPEGIARVVGISGRDARALQSGMSHHYYTILIIGFMLIAIAFIGV